MGDGTWSPKAGNRWAPWWLTWLSVQDIGGGHIALGYMNTEEFEALPAELQPLVRRKRSFGRKFGDVECWWPPCHTK